jgi:Putative MetA-pathway of phenol degradation
MMPPRHPRGLFRVCLCLALGIVAALPANAQDAPPDLPPLPPSVPAEAVRTEPGKEDNDEDRGAEKKEREEFIETDRNSFTFSTRTAPLGRFILESAYTNISIGSEGTKHSFPESVLRYGVGDRLELRFGYNYETGPANREAPEGDIAGNFGINAEQQVFYGFKYQVSRPRKESRWIPETAYLLQFHTPIGSIERRTQVRTGLAWGWILPNGWTFDSGMRFGTDREGVDNYVLWAPSSVLKIPLGREKRWFTHFEYFGIMSEFKEKDFSKQFVDTGLHYFVTPNCEVGAIVAFGINEQTRGTLVNVGFGFQF